MTSKMVQEPRILIVDDEQANIDLLVSCLEDDGFTNLSATARPAEVAGLFDEFHPDLILLDLHMPIVDGFGVLKQVRGRQDPDEYLPILVLTADVTAATKQRALSSGATDFITKPLDLIEVVLRIRNLLETRNLHQEHRAARQLAERASQRATLLADASKLLGSSFDYHTTLSVLCKTFVPAVADFCVVDVVEDDGSIMRVGSAHVDPMKIPLLGDLPFARPEAEPLHNPVLRALERCEATLVPELTDALLVIMLADEDYRYVQEHLKPCSLLVVPIEGPGKVHGALTLVHADSGRSFDQEDLELARELARRAGITIENAQLFDQAQQATRARDELLAVVAHDLRNPLSTVMMGSTMLHDGAGSDQQRRHADMVSKAAGRMQRLIEDLLEANRSARGKLNIEPIPERVDIFVKEAVANLSPLASARGIDLTGEVIGELPQVLMDSSRIMQVLSNLVGNALKFTPECGRVAIRCEEVEEGVRFAVSDTGPGIPADQIPYIFGQFWQASDNDTRGVGLGLSIVRGIIDNHQGRVWVDSVLGQGATFYFTLPLARSGEEAEKGLQDPALSPALG
mgnify:CR=1 FL=1